MLIQSHLTRVRKTAEDDVHHVTDLPVDYVGRGEATVPDGPACQQITRVATY